MGNGNDKFEQSLKEIEDMASRIELQLPHVSDSIYKLVKLIKVYDKNFDKLLHLMHQQRKVIKYMSKFLSKREIRKVEKYARKRMAKKK